MPKLMNKSKVECFWCHRYGHYKFECQNNLKKNGGRKSNFIENKEETSLLMACNINEKNHRNLWYLDIKCSNCMSWDKSIFLI